MRDRTAWLTRGNFQLKSLRQLTLGLAFLGGVISAPATNWYVSGSVSSSGNGSSWATAWKTPANIAWTSISPGDVIYFDGGTSGMSYGSFGTITASGTSTSYITIARSTESGRDGIVTIATPFLISGNYIKFDGGGYKPVTGSVNTFGGPLYRCGIVFTCDSSSYTATVPSGASIAASGANPWFRYCYFNGTYGAGTGHSFGAANSTGFVMERCWFYQSCYEDQMVYQASGSGGSVALTNTVFQDNNKPNRSDTAHRDVMNPWTGVGGWNLYVVNCMFFDTPGHASDQPQGDEFLLQVGYGGSTTPMNNVVAINNVCYDTARFIAFGSQNSGVNSFTLYNNTINNVINGDNLGVTGATYTSANNLGNSSNPGYLNSANPLGADGIPFTADDGFDLTAGSSAINAGSNVGVTTDICGNTRTAIPDLGAYEYGAGGPATNPVVSVSPLTLDFGVVLANVATNLTFTVANAGGGVLTGMVSVAAPFQIVSGGTYSLGSNQSQTVTIQFNPAAAGSFSQTVTFTGGSGASASVSGLADVLQSGASLNPANGTVLAPFTVANAGSLAATNAYISQAVTTDLPGSGEAVCGFNITSAGNYTLSAWINAPSDAANSLYVNVDGQPTDPTMIWDIPVTAGFTNQLVSWRGTGSYTNNQFVPKVFSLTAGVHQLIVRGRESNTQLGTITLTPYVAPPPPPTGLHVVSP